MPKLMQMDVGKYVEQLVSEWLVVDTSKTEDKDDHRRDKEHETTPAGKEVNR